MNHKTIGTLALAAVLGALLCNAFAQQPAKIPNAVEEPKLLPSARGRYQPYGTATGSYFYLVDTQTGQCWSRESGGWRDIGSPVKAKE